MQNKFKMGGGGESIRWDLIKTVKNSHSAKNEGESIFFQKTSFFFFSIYALREHILRIILSW